MRRGRQIDDLDARDLERHECLAHREQHRDRVGHEAAGREQQRLHGTLVEPLQVVDHAQQRGVLGQIGEQRQGAGGDQEPVGLVPSARPKAQRSAVAWGTGRAFNRSK